MTRYRIGNFIWSDRDHGRVQDRLGWTYRCFSCDALLGPGDGTLCRDCILVAPRDIHAKMRAIMARNRIPTKDEFIEQGEQT